MMPHNLLFIFRYVIHYVMKDDLLTRNHIMSLAAMAEQAKKQEMVTNVKSARHFNIDDPLEVHFRNAESHFLRMQKNVGSRKEIESIDIVFNAKLQSQFEDTKLRLGDKRKQFKWYQAPVPFRPI